MLSALIPSAAMQQHANRAFSVSKLEAHHKSSWYGACRMVEVEVEVRCTASVATCRGRE